MTQGIDISSYQSPPEDPVEIDYQKAANSGIVKFVFNKVAEGSGWKDPTAAQHTQNFHKFNVPVSPYHFHRFAASASAQAKHFKACCTEEELPPMADVEDTSIKPRDVATVADFQAALPVAKLALGQIRDYLAAISDVFGQAPIWYSGKWYLGWMISCWVIAKLDLSWMNLYMKIVASYSKAIVVPTNWDPDWWQNTSSGAVPGVFGRCDEDLWMRTDAQFNDWLLHHERPAPVAPPVVAIGTWEVIADALMPHTGPAATFPATQGVSWPVKYQILHGYQISGKWLKINPLIDEWVNLPYLKKVS